MKKTDGKKLKGVFKKYICIKQHDQTDCAAACLATISRQYGLKIPMTRIREIAGTDRRGTNALGVVTAAEKIGFDTKVVKADEENFFSGFQLPAIVHIVNETGFYHFVVVHYISQKEIIIADPAKGLINYKKEDFFKVWTGILFILSPNSKFKKGDETQNIFQRFIGLLIPQKAMLWNIFIASMLCNAFGILGSFLFKFITDNVLQSHSYSSLYIVCLAFIVLALFKVVFNAFRTHMLIILSQNIDIALVLGFYRHLVHLPMKFFDNRKVGEIISRFMDSSKVREAVSGVTLVLMVDTVMAIGGGIILYLENAFLFGITVVLVVLYGFIVALFNKPLKNINRQLMENNAQLTSFVVESINGIETVKSFNAEKSVFLKTETKFAKFMKSVFKDLGLINIQTTLVTFINSAGIIIIFWFGAIAVLKGEMTFGELLAFNSLLVYFFDPIKNLINIQPMLQSAIVASDRLGEIFDIGTESESDDENKVVLSELKGKIEFKNVSFRYGTRDWILKNINLEINQGEKIAFVGRSGSGKTTLAKLLMNFYFCEKGSIMIDDINIQDIKKSCLRNFISYVPQQTFLFSESIEYNLCMGNNSITQDELLEMAKLTKADTFIGNLPNGVQSVLDENGSNLSGGQKQRLSITRALLKKPSILIMDEATSNLDSMTEKAVEQTIDKLPDDITKIIIAHRLSTVVSCDRIYVMENGEIVECGSHYELMKLNGLYNEMVKGQLKGVYEYV